MPQLYHYYISAAIYVSVSTLGRPLQLLFSQVAILAYSSCLILKGGQFLAFEALHLTSGVQKLKKLSPSTTEHSENSSFVCIDTVVH